MKTYRSPTIIDIPTDLSLTELLHTTTTPPLPPSHLISTDSLTHRSLTLHELRTNAGRLAHGLQNTFRPRDQAHWAIILPNSCDYVEIVHAVLWTGGVLCPINHAIVAAEIAHGLVVTRPEYVVVCGPVVSKVEEAIGIAEKELKSQGVFWTAPAIITIVERAPSGSYYHVPDDFASSTTLPIPHYADTRIKLATIHLSSGTTGKPKGVELTHYNFVANCKQLEAHDATQFHRGSRIVGFTPYAHIGNTTFPLFFGPYMGIWHHAMPQFELEAFAKLVDSVKPTIFQGVPSVVISLVNTDVTERYDFSKAEKIDCGGPPFKKEMFERLMSRAPWRVNQVYGMTEAAGYVAYQRKSDVQPETVVGPLLPNIEITLRVNDGKDDAPEGGPGEMWLRGPNITRGYAFNSEANKNAFPVEGWYNTGDVCTISATSIISVVGRTKELIKYKGFQVSPAELETYLNSHPHVTESGVGPVYDESQLTELPTAYVVLREHLIQEKDRKQALLEIQAEVDGKVSGYKKLRGGVWEVKSLPKNPTGKILRKQLKEQRIKDVLTVKKTVFVVGGSGGLGKEMAKVLSAQGADITIFARNLAQLDIAKEEIASARKSDNQTIHAVAVDMSDASATHSTLIAQPRLPDTLYCVAGGTANELGYMIDVEPSAFERCMNNNFYSSLYPAQTILKAWVEDDKTTPKPPIPRDRRIIFVNSAKFAQRGLADTLRLEVTRYSGPISLYKVQCIFAHNFITPTFIAEQKNKPELTKRLEGTTGSLQDWENSGKFPYAEEIAPEIVAAVQTGDFAVMDGRFEPQLCWAMAIGTSPKRGWGVWDTFFAMLASIIFPIITWDWAKMTKGDALRRSGGGDVKRD
ncbi:acetyl-CoA synthetase-like protein [Lentithecium fluviatile CBS 122367]|uniref:Acetyl-CoA synthetase-like protein n=1 Tax=Lentithecium fluviatile CBS 122367 TaxID=1168545 RepID=A0A6G1IEP8_9PLEO|nr:acetyl-CoA synthetase-like protein [Lentithecium fluviatile CBS 122367]